MTFFEYLFYIDIPVSMIIFTFILMKVNSNIKKRKQYTYED